MYFNWLRTSGLSFRIWKKTQAKKTQAKSKLKQKTPKKLKKIIEKLNLPENFDSTLHSISLWNSKMSIFKDFFTQNLEFSPITQRFFGESPWFFPKNSRFFAKTQGISAKTQFTGKFISLWSHLMCETTSLK